MSEEIATQQNTAQTDPYLDSSKAFHLEMPLYRNYDLGIGMIKEKIYELMTSGGTVDAYCIWCKKDSVFQAHPTSKWVLSQWQSQIQNELQEFGWSCAHNNSHYYRTYYLVLRGSNDFRKVGQFPSGADFQIPQAQGYRKILDKDQYTEFTRGIGLAAHGVGIGSFVYLRRVFEDLIEEAYVLAKKDEGFDNEAYKKARMDEKIEMLKDYLPEFLVENKVLYSILSKGIHELTEDECLQHFETVKIGIEQILDEKIIRKEKADKVAKAREAIQKAQGQIANPK